MVTAGEGLRHENVANLSADAHSILSLYHALIKLRKAAPELVAGTYAPVATTGDLLIYRREYQGKALLIVLNLGADPITIGSDTMTFPGAILLPPIWIARARPSPAVWTCAATKA